MKRKIFTLFLGTLFVAGVFAQQPSGEIVKASVAPVIDGVVDAVWAEANVYDIALPIGTETPTLGEAGETTWAALWTMDGIFVLLKVTDDDFYPSYAATPPSTNTWEWDKPEIYFDVNYNLADGKGPMTAGSGHYQVAPGFLDGSNDGTVRTDNGSTFAFMVDGSNYIGEYFVPFTKLLDENSVAVDKTGNIGFDVTIIDRDRTADTRRRQVWANTDAAAESWSNMDGCGIVTLLGAEPGVDVESITLSGGTTITTDNGTLQLVAAILPEDATNKVIKWTIENGTGKASVDETGLVKGISDGTVTVTAAATDGSYVDATIEITVSGQVTTVQELNLIKNWNMDELNADGKTAKYWGGWTDASPGHEVVEGVSVHHPVVSANVWNYQFTQTPLNALPNVDYVYTFVAWADVDRTINTDFEDITAGAGNPRYGTSTDPESNGSSDWTFPVTTSPTKFVFHVNFDKMTEATTQQVAFFLGAFTDVSTVYVDSVLLVTAEQYASAVKVPTTAVSGVKIYPNPIDNSNVLNVVLTAANSKVTIYNSVGRKVEEVIVNGSIAKIDVSSYARGMYFVKVNNDSVQKFVK